MARDRRTLRVTDARRPDVIDEINFLPKSNNRRGTEMLGGVNIHINTDDRDARSDFIFTPVFLLFPDGNELTLLTQLDAIRESLRCDRSGFIPSVEISKIYPDIMII